MRKTQHPNFDHCFERYNDRELCLLPFGGILLTSSSLSSSTRTVKEHLVELRASRAASRNWKHKCTILWFEYSTIQQFIYMVIWKWAFLNRNFALELSIFDKLQMVEAHNSIPTKARINHVYKICIVARNNVISR